MSRLGPDGSFQDEGPATHVPGATYVARGAATDLSAAPLWMAFRDHYTRARERRQLGDAGQWASAEEQSACPCS